MLEADRAQAVSDLQAENVFAPTGQPAGPFALRLSVHDGRLVFDIRRLDETPLTAIVLALGPFRWLIKDYQMLVESHVLAVQQGREERIQAIDMGRRGLHNEGAELLIARLRGKVMIDFATARRLFTLICVCAPAHLKARPDGRRSGGTGHDHRLLGHPRRDHSSHRMRVAGQGRRHGVRQRGTARVDRATVRLAPARRLGAAQPLRSVSGVRRRGRRRRSRACAAGLGRRARRRLRCAADFYIAAYVLDRPSLRSALWSLAFLCVLGLFAISA